MGVDATNGNSNIGGLWFNNTDRKKFQLDETQKSQALGGGVGFAPNGASFADTVKGTFGGDSGNNCGVI